MTVARSRGYFLSALADCGVVLDSGRKGGCQAAAPFHVNDTRQSACLLKTEVIATPDGTDSQNLVKSPSLFPCQIGRLASAQLAKPRRLES